MIAVAKDAYDEAISYLRSNPDKIYKVWASPYRSAGILFQFATRDDSTVGRSGCLTMIVNPSIKCNAETPELTEAIRKDSRIPHRPSDITIESLEVFAEWQRKLDSTLQRPEPVWNG